MSAKDIVSISILALLTTSSVANKIESSGDGDWNSSSTWNCSCTPSNSDTVLIHAGDTVDLGNDQTVAELAIEKGGALDDDGNGKNFYIEGDLDLDGKITGQISIYLRQSSIIEGKGSFESPNAVKFRDGPDTIRASADLSFDGYFDLNGGVKVVNKGRIKVHKKIQANGSSDEWIQKQDAVLKAGKEIGQLTLKCDAPGNLVEYFGAGANVKSPSTPYHHLRFSGSNTFQIQSPITVKGDLSIGSILDGNGENIVLHGDWLNDGVFKHNGGGTVILKGVGDQRINPPTVGEEFYRLKIDKSVGKVILDGGGVAIKNELNMVQGNIDPSGYRLTLGVSTSATGNLLHTSGLIEGAFKRFLANTGSLSFPIGNSSASREAILTVNSLNSGGAVLIGFEDEDPGMQGIPIEDQGDSIHNVWAEGYWTFQKDDGVDLGNFDIDLEGEGFTSFTVSDSTPRLIHRGHGNDEWKVSGTHQVPQGDTGRRDGLSLSFPFHICWGDTSDCEPPESMEISGDMDVCQGSNNVQYEASPSANSYSWTVEEGSIVNSSSNSIEVDWSTKGKEGNVRVRGENGCRAGPQTDSVVSIHSIPPEEIIGRNSVAKNTTDQPYQVAGRAGYSYDWSITSSASISSGQGSDSIQVDFGGPGLDTLEVIADANNGCSQATMIDTVIRVYDRVKSVADGDWNDPSTWDCNCDPSDSASVLIRSSDTVDLGNDQTCKHFKIESGGALDDNGNGKNFFVKGNFTLHGTVESQTQVYLEGKGTYAGGSGEIKSPNALHFKEGDKEIQKSADLRKTAGKAVVHSNVQVYNYGAFEVEGQLNGNNQYSQWIQKKDAVLRGGASILGGSGDLIASAPGNKVVYFDGTGTGTDIKAPEQGVFHHLQLEGGSTNEAQSPLTINGDLTVSDGVKFLLGGKTEVGREVRIKNSAVLDVSSNYHPLELKGNWVNTSSYSSPDPFRERMGKVFLLGDRHQTLRNVNDETFHKLELDKSGGKVKLAQNSDIIISDSLILKNGVIDGASNNSLVILPSGAASTKGDPNSYVSGGVRRTGSSAFFFPIGKSGIWAPLEISSTVNGGTVGFKAEYHDSTFADATTSGGLNNVSSVEFWNLERSSGSDSVQVMLHWKDGTRSGIDDVSGSDLRVSWYDGADWIDEGQASISGDLQSGKVNSGVVENYGKFTFGSLSDSSNPLGGIRTVASGAWGDASNWNVAFYPDSTHRAMIQNGHDIDLTGDRSCEHLMVQQGGELDLGNHRFDLSGDLKMSGNLKPGSGTLAMTGDGQQKLQGDMGFYDLLVDNPSRVSITSGKQKVAHELIINQGVLDVSGSNAFKLLSDSAGWTARIKPLTGGDSIVGKVKAQRWINSGNAGWIDLASPFKVEGGQPNVADWDDDFYISGKTTGGFDDGCAWSNGCFWSVKTYDPSTGDYSDVTDTSKVLAQGEGFELFMGDEGGTSNMLDDTTVTVEGEVRTGSFSVGASTMNGAFNLIGNPFASQIDFDDLYANNNIGDTYYVAAATGNFETYQVGVGSSDPSVPNNGTIASSQGFWITSNDGSDVTFDQSMKTSNSTSFSKRGQSGARTFNLNIKSDMNRFSCRSFIRTVPTADYGYDEADVLHKPSPVKGAPALVFETSQGDLLRWNAIPTDTQWVEITVRTKVDSSGFYTLKAEGDPSPFNCALLRDKKKNEVTDLLSEDSINVHLESGQGSDRFQLRLQKRDCPEATGMKEENEALANSLHIYPNPVKSGKGFVMTIEGNKVAEETIRVDLKDVMGRSCSNCLNQLQQKGKNSFAVEPKKDLDQGVYILTVWIGDKSYQKRLIVEE